MAANGTKGNLNETIELSAVRGQLVDDTGQRWWLPKELLRGVSTVLGFECTHYFNGAYLDVRVEQNNAAAVAEYILRGRKGVFGNAKQREISSLGNYWAGTFSSIPPGQNLRVVADFVPGANSDRRDGPGGIPKSFEFEMELVIGTVTESEPPEKSKDLRLENLVFDQIVLPSTATQE